MLKFLLRRFCSLLLTMFLVSVIVYLIAEVSPGNVARNILGPYATPEQEASFLAQNGLDKPFYKRYLYWVFGSIGHASNLIGMPLKRIRTHGGFEEWWAVRKNGALIRWTLQGEDLIGIVLQTDGTITKQLDNGRWKHEKNGGKESYTFWGVDTMNHAVKWMKGTKKEVWSLTAAGVWQKSSGGPVEYIPLSKGFLRADPGISITTGRPVSNVLFVRIRNSMFLAGTAFFMVMPFALFLGIVAGLKEGSSVDFIISIGGMMFSVVPEFVTGIFLILIMSSWLKIVPGVTVFAEMAPWQRIDMLILPVLTLALVELGYILRMTRSSILEVMQEAYVRTAFLKGLPYWRVVIIHVLRNAMFAPITVIMMHVSWLVGGIMIVEVVFGYPGLGKYLLEAALFKDINVIEAGTMIMVLVSGVAQLIADVIYTFLNPRVRYE